MQRAPERRRGAGPLLLLALVALAAAPRLVRAVTDAADGTLVACASPSPPCPRLLALLLAASWFRGLPLRRRSIVRWFGVLRARVGCSGLVGGTLLRSEASSHPSRGIGLILCGADVLVQLCVLPGSGDSRCSRTLLFSPARPPVIKDICGADVR